MPCAAWRHRCQIPRRPRRLPGPSVVPVVSLGADPVFSGERFLLPLSSGAQGLSARSSRFFGHPQDICCLSPVHGCFPPGHAQVRPQQLGITAGLAFRPRRTLGRLTASAEAFQKEAGEAGRISFERKAADVARPRPAERGRPDAEDRGQGPQPGPASQDHRDCWPGECPHRGRRRLHPARIRARNIGPAELGHELERLGYRQLRCQ